MPRRSASRRIDSASSPSASSSLRAASTISVARGLSLLGALEAVTGAKTVAQRPVKADVEAPRERADEEAERDEIEGGEHHHHERHPEAVDEVIEAHRARVELALLEVRGGAVEERQVGTEPEGRELPEAGRVLGNLEGDRDEQECCERCVLESADCIPGSDGGRCVHRISPFDLTS